MLTLRTLGPLRLAGPAGDVLRGRRKELALLAYLARRSPHSVSRAELAALLWGERPEGNARASLRQALLHLKRALPAGLHVEAETVLLTPGALEFDVTCFEEDLAAGRLAEAVARWESPFLADADDAGGEAYRAWVETERKALRRRFAWALEQLVEEADRRGDKEAAVRWAERWAEAFPLEERPAARLIAALQRAGRAGDALARHAAFVTRLRVELDTAPSPEFVRLGSEAASAARESLLARRTPGSTALFTPDLVGRADALAALAAAWRAAKAGTTTLVLVEGEAGIGKTRLCEEFLRSLAEGKDRVVVLRARTYADGHEQPYRVVRELCTGLAHAPGVSTAPPGALREVGRLVPALHERFPQLPEAGAPDWELDEAASQVLADVAAEQPVILFIDDFPAADAASRELILAVAGRLRAAHILLILTGDPGTLASLHTTYGAQPVRLQPLGELDVEALVSSMLELPPDERRDLAARLHRDTGGVPLYLVETMAALLDEGHIAPDAGGVWRVASAVGDRPLPVPGGVQDAVGRRLALLGTSARQLAEATAVLATPAGSDLLREVSGLPGVELHEALEELLARHLLRESPGPPHGYAFAHETSRRATYELIPPARRRELHAGAGQALGARRPTDNDTGAAVRYHRARAGSARWLPPWVRSRRAAMTVGALAVLAGSAVTVAWPRGIGFRERDWIVLADLKNESGDSVFDQSLTAALAVAVSQSRYAYLYPRARVRETLRRMQRDSVQRLDELTAREVAQREGLRAVVALGIARRDTVYTLTARVVDPATGADLADLSATAAGKDRVLYALDDLTRRLRRKLGESLRAVQRHSVYLPQASTSSLEALKRFAEGREAHANDRYREAYGLWEEAIALDSGFAWAHAALGSLQYWSNERENADRHVRAALNLVDRLPDRERLQIRQLTARGAEAVRLARVYLQEYPDDRDGWFGLGRRLQESANLTEAMEAYRRALEIDPHHEGSLINSAVCYDFLGRPGEAVAAFERAFAMRPEGMTQIGGDINRIYGFSYLRLGDSARARAIFERVLSGDTGQRASGHRSLALFHMYYGRYDAAIGHLRQAVLLTAPAGSVSEYRNRVYLAAAYRAKGRAAAADVQLAAADELQSRKRMPPPFVAFLGQQYARHGKLAEAARALDSMTVRMNPADPADRAAVELVRGEIALGRGDVATALDALGVAAGLKSFNYIREAVARAELAAGRWEWAVAMYQEMIRDSAIGWEVQEPWIMAPYELGRRYESRGDTGNAIAYYRRFADRWAAGDDDLVALADARRKLRELERTTDPKVLSGSRPRGDGRRR